MITDEELIIDSEVTTEVRATEDELTVPVVNSEMTTEEEELRATVVDSEATARRS